MKRFLVSLFITLQVPILFALGGGDFTELGFSLARTYLVAATVFAFAYSWPLWDER